MFIPPKQNFHITDDASPKSPLSFPDNFIKFSKDNLKVLDDFSTTITALHKNVMQPVKSSRINISNLSCRAPHGMLKSSFREQFCPFHTTAKTRASNFNSRHIGLVRYRRLQVHYYPNKSHQSYNNKKQKKTSYPRKECCRPTLKHPRENKLTKMLE